MDISVVIVNWNTRKLLLNCIDSIYKTVKNISMEIWVVDNASTDDSVASARRLYPDVKIIQNKENLGFAAANNQAFKRMQGRYVVLLNTDTLLTEGAVERIYSFMEDRPDTGMACGQLLNPDESKQNSIANFPGVLSLLCNETILRILLPEKFPSKRKTFKHPIEVDSCIGACLLVRKKAMDQVGFFDEKYFFFFEETDWAYRMKQAGWKIYFVPLARIYHFQGQSVGHNFRSRVLYYGSRYIYFKKWHPDHFLLIRLIVFGRLVVDAALNLVGFALTLGLQSGIKKKLEVYIRLIRWHIEGCPGIHGNNDETDGICNTVSQKVVDKKR